MKGVSSMGDRESDATAGYGALGGPEKEHEHGEIKSIATGSPPTASAPGKSSTTLPTDNMNESEDSDVVSSWIFPTVSLAGNASTDKQSNDSAFVSPPSDGIDAPTLVVEPQDVERQVVKEHGDRRHDIAFVAPGVDGSSTINNAPLDGSFRGESKTQKHADATRDISFTPPSDIIQGEAHNDLADGSVSPLNGSFVVDSEEKQLRMKDASARDIDFAPAGSALQTTAPPSIGSFLEDRSMRVLDLPQKEINVTPDRTGKDMHTSPPPKQGSFVGANAQRPEQVVTAVSRISSRDREIDFSPGASEMETAPPPARGAFVDEKTQSADRGLHREIDLPPETTGKEMPTKSPPLQGSFRGQIILHSEGSQEIVQQSQASRSDTELSSVTDELKPVSSNEEAQGLSESILKIGSMLRSSHDELDHDDGPDQTDEEDDLLDSLLGDDDSEVDAKPPEELGGGPSVEAAVDATNSSKNSTVEVDNTKGEITIAGTIEGYTNDNSYHPDQEMSSLEAALEAALDEPIEGPREFVIKTAHVADDNDGYVPDESITKLEALLDAALDASSVQQDEIHREENHLDDFLDKALDSEVEINFEASHAEANIDRTLDPKPQGTKPLKARSTRSAPKVSRFTIPTSSAKAKTKDSVGSGKKPEKRKKSVFSRTVPLNLGHFARPTKAARAKTNEKGREESPQKVARPARSVFRISNKDSSTPLLSKASKASRKPDVPKFRNSASNTRHDYPSEDGRLPRKPAVPRFKCLRKSLAKTKTKELPPRKPPVPKFRPVSGDESFMATTASARKKVGAHDKKEGMLSRFRGWTNPGSNRNTPQLDKRPSSVSKRLFGKSKDRPLPQDQSEANRSIDAFERLAQPKATTPGRPRYEITGDPSSAHHPNFYALSPLAAESNVTLSSYCSVTYFKSPRREGSKGCQKKFNPYLHTYRGPCELCVFFLSDEERALLDSTGRSIRVMFTTGGCCGTCEIFPRSFDDQPARLCRACYQNSHRKVFERFTSKWSRRVRRVPPMNIPDHGEGFD